MPARLYGQVVIGFLLSGSIAGGVPRLSGSLTTTVALQGQVKASARAYGSLGTSIPLQGVVRASSRAYGNAAISMFLDGTIKASSRAYGSLGTSVPITGAIKASSKAYGQIATTVALEGRALGLSRLYGQLSTVDAVPLAGAIKASSLASGQLVTTVSLGGRIKALSRAFGALETTVEMGGQLAGFGRLYGNITAPAPATLAGRAVASGRLYGQLRTTLAIQPSYVRGSGRAYSELSIIGSTDPYDNTLVDAQAEIESVKATIPAGLSTTLRPGALTFDYLLAYTLGPVAIGSTTEGVLNHAWYVKAEQGRVVYARSNDAYNAWQAEQQLFTFSGADITELDAAFEQNGRIVVVAERPTGTAGAPELWIYWFKPSAAAFVFEKFDAGRTPKVVLDNPNDTAISDVHVAYIKDGSGLLTRRQSELYATPHATVFTESTDWFLEEFARNRGNRLVAILSRRIGDRYILDRVESTLYPFYPDDKVQIGARVLSTSALDVIALTQLVDGDEGSITAAVLDTSSLSAPVITHDVYDKDTGSIVAAALDTSTLAVVVIEHLVYDKDTGEVLAAVLDTSTLVVAVITDLTDEDEDVGEITASVLATSTLEIP